MINGLSLFSNVGIAETYFSEIGVNIKVANEIDERRALFYRKMYPNTKIIIGDISEEYEKIIDEAKKENCDFLLATPPCQGFSMAGRRTVDDHRNDLIKYVLQAIDDLSPTYVVIENVMRFSDHIIIYKGVKGTIMEVLIKKFQGKYFFSNEVLDSKNYGVPQSRKRLFILMSKINIPKFPEKEKIVTVKEAIGHLESLNPIVREELKGNSKQEKNYHSPPIHCRRHIECMKNTPTGKSAFENEKHYPKKTNGKRVKGYNTTYKRMNWDEPAPTITTANGVLSSQCNVHPGRKLSNGEYSDPRVLTLLEIFILFSLPADWKFPSGFSESFVRTVIGEGIPPIWIKKIVSKLIEDENE